MIGSRRARRTFVLDGIVPASDSYLSRPRLIRDASFLEADRREIALRWGSIIASEVYDPVNPCSCLTLILACIVYRQARGISRITAAPDFLFDSVLSARSSGRASSSTARAKSTPPSSKCVSLSVYFCTNLVGPLCSPTTRGSSSHATSSSSSSRNARPPIGA